MSLRYLQTNKYYFGMQLIVIYSAIASDIKLKQLIHDLSINLLIFVRLIA